MPTASTWPNECETRRMAVALIAGDPTATGEIATAFLDPLREYLQRRFPTSEPHQCESAAADAILATIHRTNHFDPNRMALGAFLRMVARNDLRNLRQKDARRKRGIPLECVAELPDRRNHMSEDHAEHSWDDPRLRAEIAAFNPTDRIVLDLMREGERGTMVFARVLGLTTTSPDELAAEVKRCKDRLKKRLARAVGGAE